MIIILYGRTGGKMWKDKLRNSFLFILLKSIQNKISNDKVESSLNQYRNLYSISTFDYVKFKKEVCTYVKSNNGNKVYKYKFSSTSNESELYSSVYALMTLGLFNEVELLTMDEKSEWGEYLLSFQNKDGLFFDKKLDTPLASSIHYWGWYHLLPHLIIALDYLNIKPKYDFQFIFKLFETQTVKEWLESRNWADNYLVVSNEVMNITVLLQYSRDIFNNEKSREYVDKILIWLKFNIKDEKTGLWGYKTKRSKIDISKAIKTAYHSMPMHTHDNDLSEINIDNLVKYTIQTQNSFGTYGPSCLTDGCEDIDSIYLLTQLPIPNEFKNDVDKSVEVFFNKVFINMNDDGGFVFKRTQSFQYADSKLKSNIDESNMFATWFRTLSIAYACKYLSIENDFMFVNISGYQFYRHNK